MATLAVQKPASQAWPLCPDGHAGSVWSHGFRRRRDGLYARPVFACHHEPCDATCQERDERRKSPCAGVHYFTQTSQARTHKHPQGMWCGECSRDRTIRDGLPIAHNWEFEARLIAEALIAVGKGESYRKAGQAMRVSARRFELNNGVLMVSEFGGSVMRYLDHFGRLILDGTEHVEGYEDWEGVEHKEWPEVLVLDAWPLRKREAVEGDPFSFEQSGSGAVLVAVGYSGLVQKSRRRTRDENDNLVERKPKQKRRSHIWRVGLAGGYNRWAWADFLAELPGTPRWIVADGDSAVRLAIKMRWGDGPDAPVVFSCEGHLQRKFRERARDEDKLDGIDIWRLWPEYKRWTEDPLPGPLWSRDHYRRFLDAVLAYPPEKVENITSWIRHHDETIRRQFDLRDAFHGYPRGAGAAEDAIEEVQRAVGDRHKQLQNVYRTRLMLGLIRAHEGGHDDLATYTRVIRDELQKTNGRPKLDWREHHYTGRVKRGRPGPAGSLFALADEFQKLGEREQLAYWVDAQASSVATKLLHHNIFHFLNGYPPLTLTDAATPAVKVAGKLLRDFPLIRREWDPTNPGDPDTLPAGNYNQKVGWICHEDQTHRWRTVVSARTMRLSGCQQCQRLRGAAAPTIEPRAALQAIRDAWGDLDDAAATSPIPVTLAAASGPDDEDF